MRWDERRDYKARERERFRGGIKDRWEAEQVKPNEFNRFKQMKETNANANAAKEEITRANKHN